MEVRSWLAWLAERPCRQVGLSGAHAFWVLKEPNANCGRGVRVFSELLPCLAQARACGWRAVVQKYIERPLLVEGGRKCDIRVWVLVSSWNPACVWVYGEPYLRLAARPLTWEAQTVGDPKVHLTNRAVQKQGRAGGKEPLQEDEDHIWLLSKFLRWADASLGP